MPLKKRKRFSITAYCMLLGAHIPLRRSPVPILEITWRFSFCSNTKERSLTKMVGSITKEYVYFQVCCTDKRNTTTVHVHRRRGMFLHYLVYITRALYGKETFTFNPKLNSSIHRLPFLHQACFAWSFEFSQ